MKIILTSKGFGDYYATDNVLSQINKKFSILEVLLVATPYLHMALKNI